MFHHVCVYVCSCFVRMAMRMGMFCGLWGCFWRGCLWRGVHVRSPKSVCVCVCVCVCECVCVCVCGVGKWCVFSCLYCLLSSFFLSSVSFLFCRFLYVLFRMFNLMYPSWKYLFWLRRVIGCLHIRVALLHISHFAFFSMHINTWSCWFRGDCLFVCTLILALSSKFFPPHALFCQTEMLF